ncbi:MAG: hypothetical protein KC777_06730 [Cyanobacteria bacterium HKST-UBA02]|nr:hypothetical protein [Cyanobacteria bacterium HKST-UBA02]
MAHSYGSLHPTKKISYTQLEYEYAVEKNIPVAAFVIDSNASWPANLVDKENVKELNEFKNLVKQRMVNFWNNADALKANVTASLNELILNTHRPGWMRTTDALPQIPLGPKQTAETPTPESSAVTVDCEFTFEKQQISKEQWGFTLTVFAQNALSRDVTDYEIVVKVPRGLLSTGNANDSSRSTTHDTSTLMSFVYPPATNSIGPKRLLPGKREKLFTINCLIHKHNLGLMEETLLDEILVEVFASNQTKQLISYKVKDVNPYKLLKIDSTDLAFNRIYRLTESPNRLPGNEIKAVDSSLSISRSVKSKLEAAIEQLPLRHFVEIYQSDEFQTLDGRILDFDKLIFSKQEGLERLSNIFKNRINEHIYSALFADVEVKSKRTTSTSDGVLLVDATTGLVEEKLQEVLKNFDEHSGIVANDVCIGLSLDELEDLKHAEALSTTTKDFVFKNGVLKYYHGATIINLPRKVFRENGGTRHCFALAKYGIQVNWYLEESDNEVICHIGAVRLDGSCVQELNTTA